MILKYGNYYNIITYIVLLSYMYNIYKDDAIFLKH